MSSFLSTAKPTRLSIVGAAPAGCYTLQQVLLRFAEDVHVDVYESRDTPYGLLDTGVAPDRHGTKAIQRQFERALASPRTRLHLRTEVTPTDVRSLRSTSAAVVLATGAAGERLHPITRSLPGLAITGTDIAALANGVVTPAIDRWSPGAHVVVARSSQMSTGVR